MDAMQGRQALLGFSLTLAALEIADGFRLELPWMAWFFALMLLTGAAWLWRTGNRGAILMLGGLHLFELVMLLLVFRTAEQAPPTWLWWLFVILSVGGTASAGWTLMARRRAHAS